MGPEPLHAVAVLLDGGDHFPELDESLVIHGKIELAMSEDTGHHPADLLHLVVVHKELAVLSTDGTGLVTEISVFLAFSHHDDYLFSVMRHSRLP